MHQFNTRYMHLIYHQNDAPKYNNTKKITLPFHSSMKSIPRDDKNRGSTHQKVTPPMSAEICVVHVAARLR